MKVFECCCGWDKDKDISLCMCICGHKVITDEIRNLAAYNEIVDNMPRLIHLYRVQYSTSKVEYVKRLPM